VVSSWGTEIRPSNINGLSAEAVVLQTACESEGTLLPAGGLGKGLCLEEGL
jgi:hypothetical protein